MGNQVTRSSHTGIIIYCNMVPVLWYSKKQNAIETSTFKSEFITLKIATELLEGIRYKLRMFGVPINEAEGNARFFHFELNSNKYCLIILLSYYSNYIILLIYISTYLVYTITSRYIICRNITCLTH